MAAQQKYKLITQDENQVWPHLNRKPQSHSYLLLIGQPKLKLVSLSKVYFSNSQIWCFKHMILRVVQIDIRNKSKSGFWSPPSPSKCHSMCIRESIFSFNLSACSRLGQKEWEKYIYIFNWLFIHYAYSAFRNCNEIFTLSDGQHQQKNSWN